MNGLPQAVPNQGNWSLFENRLSVPVKCQGRGKFQQTPETRAWVRVAAQLPCAGQWLTDASGGGRRVWTWLRVTSVRGGPSPGPQEASETLGCNGWTLRKSFWSWRLLQGAGEMLKPGSLCEATVGGWQARVLLFQLQVASLRWRFTYAGFCGSPLTGCGVRLVVAATAQCLEEPLVRLPRRGLVRVLHLGVLPRAPPSSLPLRGVSYGPMILPPKRLAVASVLRVCHTYFLSAGLPARLHFIDSPG